MAEKFSLKDQLFNPTKVERIAGEIHNAYPGFRKAVFVREVVGKFPELELKARISWIAECLNKHLPGEYTNGLAVLLKVLPPASDPEQTDNDFGDFMYAPYAEYVARYGCTKKHLTLSLRSLQEITQRFSAEYAIRNFINAFPDETMKELLVWADNPNYHVRRLCSEGTRPKMPWAQKINTPVAAPLTILDRLYADKTRYVTRSVANHINDISKVDPALAIRTLIRWKKTGKQKPDEMNYMIRHALRTLIKQGNEQALQLIGFSSSVEVSLSKFAVPSRVKMNTALEFSFAVSSLADADLIIDYTLYFQNKSGKLNSKKVFKLTRLSVAGGKTAQVAKRHMLREKMTTRTLYPGKHEIEIQVNGQPKAKRSFLLE